MDEELRNLERLAETGDTDAIRRLRQMRRRLSGSRPKKFYYCLTWTEIFKMLNFDYSDYEEKIEEAASDLAYRITESEFEDQEEDDENFEALAAEKEERRFEIQNQISTNAFKNNLDYAAGVVEEIVDKINEWASRGLQMASFDRARHRSGLAVEMIRLQNSNHWEEPAICFQLYRPFLAVYTEAAAGVYGTSDEGQGLKDMDAKDVIRVGKWIAELEGETHFDILLNDRIMDQDLSNLVD